MAGLRGRGRLCALANHAGPGRCDERDRDRLCEGASPLTGGDELRLVRSARRAGPEQGGRRRGDGQPRHRAGDRALSIRAVPSRSSSAPSRRRATAPSRPAGARGSCAHAVTGAITTSRSPSYAVAGCRERADVPVALLAMVPPLQFSGWEWVALALSTPVVLWCGWPFHRAAFRARATARRRWTR